jgi:hypothetical protein
MLDAFDFCNQLHNLKKKIDLSLFVFHNLHFIFKVVSTYQKYKLV